MSLDETSNAQAPGPGFTSNSARYSESHLPELPVLLPGDFSIPDIPASSGPAFLMLLFLTAQRITRSARASKEGGILSPQRSAFPALIVMRVFLIKIKGISCKDAPFINDTVRAARSLPPCR